MNTKQIFKRKAIMVIVFFVVILTFGCLPAGGGGNATPSVKFNVGLTAISGTCNNGDGSPFNPLVCKQEVTNTLLLDDENISFSCVSQFSSSFTSHEGYQEWKIDFENGNYEALVSQSGKFAALDGMVTINNNTQSVNVSINGSNTKEPCTFQSVSSIKLLSSIGGMSPFIAIPNLTDKFIVFRKQKGSDYMYFYVKVKSISKSAPPSLPLLPLGKGSVAQILNGKYQLNSITTGV